MAPFHKPTTVHFSGSTPTRRLALLFTLFVFALTACASPATSAPAGQSDAELATSAGDILGSWSPPPGELYYEFNADGTYTVGSFAGDGNRVPVEKGTFQFDRTRLTLVETENTGDRLYPACGDNPGIYEVQLLASDALQFVRIDDPCTARYSTLSIAVRKVP